MILITESKKFPEEARRFLRPVRSGEELSFIYFSDTGELFVFTGELEELLEIAKRTGGVIAI